MINENLSSVLAQRSKWITLLIEDFWFFRIFDGHNGPQKELTSIESSFSQACTTLIAFADRLTGDWLPEPSEESSGENAERRETQPPFRKLALHAQ